ncbi:MAG: hypothetical protein Q8Q73_19130 [Stagnimonas sp.]|nr:hypothetical protein [Stagnimonas sp.]
MSRQTVRQRLALQSAKPPVIPQHYQHTEIKPLTLFAVIALLVLVGFVAGVFA